MRAAIVPAMLLAVSGVYAQDLVSHARDGNILRLALDDGAAEFEWLSGGTFRFARWWTTSAGAARAKAQVVDHQFEDAGALFEMKSEHLVVRIEKAPLRLRVGTVEGKLLFADTATPRRDSPGVMLEREYRGDEHFFGLGARPLPPVVLKNIRVTATRAFAISSLGYGQHFGDGAVDFDVGITASNRVRIKTFSGPRLEYFFYYGPGIKDVLEEHLPNAEPIEERLDTDFDAILRTKLPSDVTMLPKLSLRETVRAAINAAFSGMPLPAFDLSAFPPEDKELHRRAVQLASLFPAVFRSTEAMGPELLALRRRLIPFLQTYLQEIRDRGSPMIRPLAMQYPKDAQALNVDDAFMLGDELLVAPILAGGTRRSVYLPMGIWTDWRTNIAHPGRRTIEIEAPLDSLPLFVKNGTILPLAPDAVDGPMELHYFPRLGAEFFIWEPDLGLISQVHAAPAGEFMRLEIESKVDRLYEWVVHNIEPAKALREDTSNLKRVASLGDMQPDTWFYDTNTKNLHVRIYAGKDENRIVNVSFQ